MSRIRTVSGREIAYDAVGVGSPVLFIPGHFGYRNGCFAWLAADLASRFRTISIDNRDAGEHDPETDFYDLSDMAADAVALLDALEIERANLIGHSMGGKIALQIALDAPERVDRLVLIGSSLFASPGFEKGRPIPEPEDWWNDDGFERTRQGLPYWVGPVYRGTLSDKIVDEISELERGNKATWAGAMRQWAAAGPHDLTSALPRIQAPTLVIHGDADEIVAIDRGHALVAGIPGARLVTLEGVGHLPWVERPDLVVPAIIDFLGAGPI